MKELATEETYETYWPKCPGCSNWQEGDPIQDCQDEKTQCGHCGQFFMLTAETTQSFTAVPCKGMTLVGYWEIDDYKNRNILGIIK